MARVYRLTYENGESTDIPAEMFFGYQIGFAEFKSINGIEELDKVRASINGGGQILLRSGKNLLKSINVPRGTNLEFLY